MEKMSMSHEDYLEAIVMLGGTTEASVRSVDIATKLGVSKASVNKAVTSLKEKGLADQPYYGDITLTEEGYAYGTSVLDRHHMLFSFLTKALGIPEEQAEREACLMEHAISAALERRFLRFHPRFGPRFNGFSTGRLCACVRWRGPCFCGILEQASGITPTINEPRC